MANKTEEDKAVKDIDNAVDTTVDIALNGSTTERVTLAIGEVLGVGRVAIVTDAHINGAKSKQKIKTIYNSEG